jgi:hypothetical protein
MPLGSAVKLVRWFRITGFACWAGAVAEVRDRRTAREETEMEMI